MEDPTAKVAPLTVKAEVRLFAKETFDPFTFASSAAGAALSQVDNDNPKYGQGAGPYAERFGAAVADITTQNFFQDAVLASLLHEDPRYFRQGAGVRRLVSRGLRVEPRGGHADGRGKRQIQLFGDARNEHGHRAVERLLSGQQRERRRSGLPFWNQPGGVRAFGNLLPEFWPDIHQKFFHRKPAQPARVTPPQRWD